MALRIRVGVSWVWVLQVVLAAFFAVQGVVKLRGSAAWIERFHRWGYPNHFYLVIGLLELLGAVLLLVPRLAPAGAALLAVVMLGASGTHLMHHEPQIATTLVVLGLLSVLLYLRWPMVRGWRRGTQ